MPGVIKPIEEQDQLGTLKAIGEYLKGNVLGERGALPRSESGRYTYDLNPVEVFDKKKNPGGAIYAEPSATMDAQAIDPMGLAKVGGGVKSALGRITAGPWRSRTLEAIEKNPKLPESASPQTWLSKLKGAGLPKDEVAVAEQYLTSGSPISKIGRGTLSNVLSEALPELGVTKTTLGGAEWEAGQKRLDELTKKLSETKLNLDDIPVQESSWNPGVRSIRANPNDIYVQSNYGEPGFLVQIQDPRSNVHGGYRLTDRVFDTEEEAEIFRAGFLNSYRQYQMSSAEREARKALLEEHSRLSQEAVGKRPKWPQYNIEGLKDYKEEYFHAPLKEGGTYRNADMEMHFADKPDNLLYLKHQGTLELPDGKKSTHMSTLQNDHAAEFDALQGKKYKQEVAQYEDLITRHPEILNEPGVQEGLREHGGFRLGSKIFKAHKTVPEPIMLNTWWKHGLKESIKDAVKQGHYYFTWDPADTQMKRFAGAGEDVAQYMKNHYDNNIPGFLKKEYGVEAKKVKVGKDITPRQYSESKAWYADELPNRVFKSKEDLLDYIRKYPDEHKQDVWQIPITDEIKKKVQEGQFWSKAAKPGGKDAEGVA